MGLAERRAVENYRNTLFEGQVKRIQDACGYAIKVDLDWKSIEESPHCVRMVGSHYLEKYLFDCFAEAAEQICRDDMGRAAMKEKVTKVVFVNKDSGIDLKNKVLTISNPADGNSAYWPAVRISEYLEKQL